MNTDQVNSLEALHQAGSCGGYYHCPLCAEQASRVKQAELEAVEGFNGQPRRRRSPTQTEADQVRRQQQLRRKAKLARAARAAGRRR